MVVAAIGCFVAAHFIPAQSALLVPAGVGLLGWAKAAPGHDGGGSPPAAGAAVGVTTAVCLALTLSMGTTACTPAQVASVVKTVDTVAQVAAEASQYEADASNWLSLIETASRLFFAVAPNLSEQTKVDELLAAGRSTLSDAGKATAGVKDLDQGKLDAAYADFRGLADQLKQQSDQLGLFAPKSHAARLSHAMGAPGAPPLESPPPATPVPLCVSNFHGVS